MQVDFLSGMDGGMKKKSFFLIRLNGKIGSFTVSEDFWTSFPCGYLRKTTWNKVYTSVSRCVLNTWLIRNLASSTAEKKNSRIQGRKRTTRQEHAEN